MTPRRPARDQHPRQFNGDWVEREVAALDALAATATDALELAVSARGTCLHTTPVADGWRLTRY